MIKFHKKDYSGALAKLETAGLTDRQMGALKSRIIEDAVMEAERRVLEDGSTKYHFVGMGSITTHGSALKDATDMIRVMAFWHHTHLGHLQETQNAR